jgi:hypothetical protein
VFFASAISHIVSPLVTVPLMFIFMSEVVIYILLRKEK